MGSTERNHRFQVPMTVRSTDISMLDQCAGRWALTLIHEKDQAEATFFELGTTLHDRIEAAIDHDHDLDIALAKGHASLDMWIDRVVGGVNRVLETSKRGLNTIHDDFERMLKNWFKFVHPDSDKRLDIYDDYEWPPSTEMEFYDPNKKVWGSIDAVFIGKGANPWAIVDWKSGTQKQKDSSQLHFYTYGGGYGTNIEAWFHHLDRVQPRAIIQLADPYPGDDTVEWRIEGAREAKANLCDGNMPEFNPDWYCNFCPVQDFCPADGDTRNRDKNRTELERVLPLFRPLNEPLRR